MRDLLRYLDARLGEASTYAGLAAVLGAAHISVDAGVLHAVTLWGVVLSGALAVLIGEAGNRPGQTVATDVLAALVAGIKAMPTSAPSSPPASAPAVASGAAPLAATAPAPIAALLLAALVGLGLTACATAPQTTVAQVAVALTAADQVALQYVDLPRCGTAGATVVCSDAATVVRIKTAAATAYQAVKTAEASGASADLSLAVSAVGALSAVIPTTK